MRFGLLLFICGLAALPCAAAAAQVGQPVDAGVNSALEKSMRPVRRRTRSGNEMPRPPAGLIAQRFASQLGSISALAIADNGTIYAADQTHGRVYRLVDRSRDGRIDSTQMIVSDLDRPSGLAVVNDQLYVSDAVAVWALSLDSRAIRRVASLENASAAPLPRPLSVRRSDGALVLGLTDVGGQSGRIFAIDSQTGSASLLSKGDAPITALALTQDNVLWIGGGDKLIAVHGAVYANADGYVMSSGVDITGLMLPGQFSGTLSENLNWDDYIFAAQGGKTQPQNTKLRGYNVLSVPTRLGRPAPGVAVFVDGFAADNMRSAWGQPSAIVMDERGMFVADRWSGNVWLIKSAPAAPAKAETVEPPSPVEPLSKPDIGNEKSVVAPMGSGIETGSTITEVSRLKVGSTIIEAFDKAEAEKKAKEEAEAAEKGSNKTNSRKKGPGDKRPDP